MAAIITAGGTAATGNTGISTATQVIASGTFAGASVQIQLEADALRKAVIHTFEKPGAIKVDVGATSTITATVIGGSAATSVDVSIA